MPTSAHELPDAAAQRAALYALLGDLPPRDTPISAASVPWPVGPSV